MVSWIFASRLAVDLVARFGVRRDLFGSNWYLTNKRVDQLNRRSDFGIWLRARMAERGLTVSRLAERSRVSPTAVEMVLAGRIWMGPRLSRALAYGLRLPVDEILRAVGFLYPEDDRDDPERRELVGLLDHCDDRQRREILRYARRAVEGERGT